MPLEDGGRGRVPGELRGRSKKEYAKEAPAVAEGHETDALAGTGARTARQPVVALAARIRGLSNLALSDGCV